MTSPDTPKEELQPPSYAVVGMGSWGRRMQGILSADRTVTAVEGVRRRDEESLAAYIARLSDSLRRTGAQVTWICVSPGPHVAAMVEAALLADLHVVVEKPWLNSPNETERLQELASRRKKIVGVHYQYCLLGEVERWRQEFSSGAGLEFGGRFTVSRGNRLGIDAIDNLGSHLVSIWNYAVPQAAIMRIECGYEMSDERKVWLERAGKPVATIDFVANSEPLIQRYRAALEAAIAGAHFSFSLDFALCVARLTQRIKQSAGR